MHGFVFIDAITCSNMILSSMSHQSTEFILIRFHLREITIAANPVVQSKSWKMRKTDGPSLSSTSALIDAVNHTHVSVFQTGYLG